MKHIIFLLLMALLAQILFSACSKNTPAPVYSEQSTKIVLPELAPVKLTASGIISFPPIVETSGLVRSRLWPDVLWTHNDSGDEARIFPINRNGEIIKPEWMKNYEGIEIPNSVNVDWEDITTDDDGNLIIADTGNNSNARRDLAVYIVSEPLPTETVITSARYKLNVYYPEQKKYPAEKRNFDCEGVFWAKDKLYFLTKHRSDSATRLYRLDTIDPLNRQPLTFIDDFDINGMVTGADATADGRELAVSTYTAIWLFETTGESDNYFSGRIRWLPITDDRKYEAICFYDDKLLVACEEREIFTIDKNDLVVVRE